MKALISLLMIILLTPIMYADITGTLSPDNLKGFQAVGSTATYTLCYSIDITGSANGQVDVLLLTDTTGSMGGYIAGIKSAFSSIVTAINTSLPGLDVEYAVADYRNYTDGGNYSAYGVNLLQAFTGNTTLVQAAVNSLSASGGADIPESQLKAMVNVANNWLTSSGDLGFGGRVSAQKIIIWAGDEPGHVTGDESCSSGPPPAGYYPSLASTIAALNAQGILVFGLNTQDSSGGINEPYPNSSSCSSEPVMQQQDEIATATGGASFYSVGSGGPSIESAIVASITGGVETLSNITLTLSGDTGDFTIVPLSQTITGAWTDSDSPVTGCFDFDATANPGLLGVADFDMVLLGNGAELDRSCVHLEKLGTIIIKKEITEDCIPECNEPIEFTFGGDVGGQISQGQQLVITDLQSGLYSTTEVAPGDWLVDSITVDDDNSTFSIDPDGKTGTVLFQLDPGEVVTAVFTNRKPVVVLELSSTVGGRVTWPGEGIFEYCQDTELCLEVELDSSLYTFLGWRGTLWAAAPAHAGEPFDMDGATDQCGIPLDSVDAVYAGCTPLTLTHDYRIRAAFESVLDVLYVDDDAPNDVSPYDLSLGDPCENGTVDHPFDSIQEAIEVAKPGATVVVLSGVYNESLDFFDKVITVTSDDLESGEPVLEYPVIQAAEGEPVVTFDYCSDPNMVLQGFVLTGGTGGSISGVRCRYSNVAIQNCLIVGNRRVGSGSVGGAALWCRQSQATLINCTLVQNYGGISGAGVYAWDDSIVTVLDSIVWDNLPVDVLTDDTSVITFVTCDVGMDTDPVDGNLNVDPEFVMPGYWEHALYPGVVVDPTQDGSVWVTGDYHLSESSPCIDTGDPLADFSQEPEPNGGQVNMGAYGNTPQATVTPTP